MHIGEKKNYKLLTIFLMIFALCGCSNAVEEQTKVLMDDSGIYCDDSKFYGDAIIASENYKLAIIDFDGKNIKNYEDITANWIDAIPEEGIVVYGNINKEIGIVKLDTDYNVVSKEVVMTSENLMIDPTIMRVEENWYMTATEIVGTPNNGDINSENGLYTIRLYCSANLSEWTPVSEIISLRNNLEDVDSFYRDGRFYVIYEKETVDGGASQICLQKSKDAEGKEWEDPAVILEGDCDHEPAAIERTWSGGYRLYYSSDKDNPGESYMGAKMYYAEYNSKFKLLQKDIEIPSTAGEGILLYDVRNSGGTQKFLFCKNYYTDHALFIEERRR